MSDEQLRLLLTAETEAEQVNVELIRQITDILASREEDEENEISTSAADFLQRAKNGRPSLFPEVADEMDPPPADSKPLKSFRHTRVFRIVLVAAVIAALFIGSSVAAGAAGLDLWGVVSRWSADVFGYFREDTSFKGGHVEESDYYYHLQSALIEYGVDFQVIPHFMPDGYEFMEFGAEETYEGNLVYGVFSNGKNRIILHYLISSTAQPNRFYAIDEASVELYELNGISFYIMTNENEYVVNWTNGNVFCNISGVSTYEDAIQMVTSIYERGNKT